MAFPSPSQFWGNIGSTLSNIRIKPEVMSSLNTLGTWLNPKNHESGLLSPLKTQNPTLPAKVATPAPLSVTGNPTTSPIIDIHSNSPIVDNSGSHSNVKTDSASIAAHIAEVNKQLQLGYSVSDKPQYDASGNMIPKANPGTDPNGGNATTPTPTTPGAEPSAFDKILSLFKTGQDQINNIPKVPSLDETTNSILAKFGYTPDSFKQVADLNTQLTSINGQINDLEKAKQLELSNATGVAGQSGDFANGEAGRIQRKYAIQEASLGAKATALTATINTLTGNYDKALASAKDYVTLATTQQRQLVSDIQYSMNFYKDVYTAMDTSDQKRMNDLLDYQSKLLQQQQTAAQNDINNELKKQGLDIQAMLAQAKLSGGGAADKLLTVDEAQKLGVPYGTTQSQAAGQHLLTALPETKAKDLTSAVKLVDDATTIKGMLNNGFQVWKMYNPLDTEGRKFAAAYNAILHTYAAEISTQLLRTHENQDTIKRLLPGAFSSQKANVSNIQQLIDRATGLIGSIDPNGTYTQQIRGQQGAGVQGSNTKQIIYQGKKYNVDANGNMTLAQ